MRPSWRLYLCSRVYALSNGRGSSTELVRSVLAEDGELSSAVLVMAWLRRGGGRGMAGRCECTAVRVRAGCGAAIHRNSRAKPRNCSSAAAADPYGLAW